MVRIDLSKIIKKNRNKWVALTSDNKELVASGSSLNHVLNLSNKKGVKDPSVFKVPSVDNLFIG